jgi:LPS-assembly lipoprotein
MWLYSRANHLGIHFLILAGFTFLSACGFRPLYGTSSYSGQVKNELASISVEEPKDRLAQMVRNHLLYLLSPDQGANAPRYKLKFKVTEQETNILVQRSTQVDRQIYQIDIKFELFDLRSPKRKIPVYSGTDLVKLSYTRTTSEFNNIRAKKSASEKASKKAAENLHIRLAAWFVRKPAS